MKLFSFLRPDELHGEIAEELQFHLEMKTEELIRRGMPSVQARRIAEKKFGSVPRIGEYGYEVRGWRQWEAIVNDLRFSLRMLKKRPAKTAALIVTLALGIGVNTAIFGVMHALLLQPLSFPHADRLVVLHQANHAVSSGVSYPHFLDWRQGSRCFQEMAVYGSASATLTEPGEPTVLMGATTSSSLFQVLGVQPVRGRLFQEKEDRWASGTRTIHPVLISDRLWRSRFEAREDTVGRLITLDGHRYTIVGIIAARFGYPIQKDPVDYWTTVAVDADPSLYGGSILTSRGYPRYDGVIARLRPGVELAQAQAEMANLAGIIEKEHPRSTSANEVLIRTTLQEVLGSENKTMVLLLYGAAFCVFLVACVNVSTILLVDAIRRRQELALRSALGAATSTLVRQMMVEALILAFGGCAVSFAVAAVALHVFLTFAPPEIPRLREIRLDGSALLYAPALSFMASLLFGCLPALSMRYQHVASALKEIHDSMGRKASGFRAGPILICGQIALSMMLTCSAALLVTSFSATLHSPRGFNSHGLLAGSLSLPVAEYGQSSPRVVGFYNALLQQIRALPGVEAASITEVLPLSGTSNSTTVEIAGARQLKTTGADLRFVDAQYFATLQMRLVGGRFFTPQDTVERPPCVIVNQTFVRRYLQGRDALGTDLRLGWGGSTVKRIVGIVGDIRPTATSPVTNPEVYVPFAQFRLQLLQVCLRRWASMACLARLPLPAPMSLGFDWRWVLRELGLSNSYSNKPWQSR